MPPNKNVVVRDLVRGDVTFNTDTLGDFVVMRSNGLPVLPCCTAGLRDCSSCDTPDSERTCFVCVSSFLLRLLSLLQCCYQCYGALVMTAWCGLARCTCSWQTCALFMRSGLVALIKNTESFAATGVQLLRGSG